MPTITDALVYSGGSELEAVGGRRLVVLKNGWLVEAHIVSPAASNAAIHIRYSKDNGANWLSWATKVNNFADSLAIAARGNVLYSISSYNQTTFQIRYWDFDKEAQGEAAAYSGVIELQTGFTTTDGKCALHIEGDSIFMAYSGKRGYNSPNVYVCEGTIQKDNSIFLKPPEQWTSYNTSTDYLQRPSIAFDSGKLVVFAEYIGSGYTSVIAMARTGMANAATSNILVRYTTISGSSYQTRAGQGIFVPRRINGLPNGRLWYAFWGYDATETANSNLRVAYSDDSGITWTVQKLTTQTGFNQTFPSITATNKNEIIIVFEGLFNAAPDVRMIKNTNGTWGSVSNIKTTTVSGFYSANTVFDLSRTYTIPPLIYRNADDSTIRFYGTWQEITISPTEGDRGSKTSRIGLLGYTLSAGETLPATAYEYINGILVNTKNPNGGLQTLTASQAIWDALRFGKYTDRKNNVPQNPKFWVQGGINVAAGSAAWPVAATTTRIRTIDSIPVVGGRSYPISVAAGYSMLVAEYNAAGNLVTYLDWYNEGSYTRVMDATTTQIIVCLRYYGNTAILPSVAPLANPSVFESNKDRQELRIENGDFAFKYTFDKRVPSDADILTAVKAVKDSQEVLLPKLRDDLSAAVATKGGAILGGQPIDELIAALNAAPNNKYASGTATVGSTAETMQYTTGATLSLRTIVVPFSSIGFVPKRIVARYKASVSEEYRLIFESGLPSAEAIYTNTVKLSTFSTTSTAYNSYNLKADAGAAYVNETGFKLPVISAFGSLYTWEAFG